MDCCVWVDVLVFKCAFRAAIAQASSLVCLRHNLGLDGAGVGGLSLGWGSVCRGLISILLLTLCITLIVLHQGCTTLRCAEDLYSRIHLSFEVLINYALAIELFGSGLRQWESFFYLFRNRCLARNLHPRILARQRSGGTADLALYFPLHKYTISQVR